MENKKDCTLPAGLRRAIDDQVSTMTASDPHLRFGPESYEDFASAIHRIVCGTKKLGKEAAEYQSLRLRAALTAKGISVPESGIFVYWGGRCFPVPALFLPADERREKAKAMAEAIVRGIGTADACSEADAAEALAESAALDEEMLAMRTAALTALLKEERPEYAVEESIGDFIILPDGSLLSMKYLYAE